MKPEIIPAILVKTKDDLLARISAVRPYLQTFQIDVMDGIFVPNKTVGIDELKQLPKLSAGQTYEFHWMVKDPLNWIRQMPGSHTHIVHIETVRSPMEFDEIERTVKESGGRLAIALNPETPLETILPYVPRVKMVLVMTVHPGFSGQSYIDGMGKKITALRKLYPKLNIEVDGGINLETIGHAYSCGANMLAAASAIFSSKDISKAISDLRDKCKASKE